MNRYTIQMMLVFGTVPHKVGMDILKAQGHDVTTPVVHYAGAVFSAEDVEQIKGYVVRWKPSAKQAGRPGLTQLFTEQAASNQDFQVVLA